jgi:hypothetical protein
LFSDLISSKFNSNKFIKSDKKHNKVIKIKNSPKQTNKLDVVKIPTPRTDSAKLIKNKSSYDLISEKANLTKNYHNIRNKSKTRKLNL